MKRILVVDDNADILVALDLLLSLHGYAVHTAIDKKEAVLAVTRQSIDLVIQDMNFTHGATSGKDGRSLFHELRELKPHLPIILITAWTQLETAIELVKAGAADYLQKPWDDVKLLELVARYTQSSSNAQAKENKQSASHADPAFIYHSPQMHALMENAEKVAKANVNVLITGPNGAGKEKLADFIHQSSTRNASEFIKVNMGALPQDLMEAELFGAEKGAYTSANQSRVGRFEAADGGTLFLDEIGNLSLTGQMKLLRVLQTGEFERLGSSETIKVDVRVVTATNADLKHAVSVGEFREDLYYRLNVIELALQPLNERVHDILPLAQHFIGADYSLSDCAVSFLESHSWPGNVRELENACKRAQVFAENHVIKAVDLGSDGNAYGKQDAAPQISEKEQIEKALLNSAGVIKHAANELGLSRQALYRRIEKYDIKISDK